MKDFIIFIISIVLFVCCLSQLHLFDRTLKGEKPEEFISLDSSYLPSGLVPYLADRHIRFELYIIPNYVKDFLTLHKDYSSVYKSRPKYTLLLYAPINPDDKNYSQFPVFYVALNHEVKDYSQYYNVLFYHANKNDDIYKTSYDNKAVTDLMEHCRNFCLIDPNNNTLFTFKNMTNSETEAIAAVIQQYVFLLKEE